MYRMNWKRATLELLEKLNKQYKEVLQDNYTFTTYDAYGGHEPVIKKKSSGSVSSIKMGCVSWKECYYNVCEAIANGWVKSMVECLRDQKE